MPVAGGRFLRTQTEDTIGRSEPDRRPRGSRRPRPPTRSIAGPASVAAVRLEGVTKRFGDVVAVDDVDLEIRDGEFFSMLGPSGSGKTTTLRMIAGFELPTEGRILLHGEDVSQRPPFERDVNTVFQDYALFPHMTVGENVEYGLLVQKVPKAEREPPRRRRAPDGPPRGLRASGSRRSCPAASASASPWPGRSSTGRVSCSSTSRSVRST